MPNVQLLSITGKTSNIVAVHADPKFTIVAVRHPFVRVPYSTNSDL
jgi:hypothetical protein